MNAPSPSLQATAGRSLLKCSQNLLYYWFVSRSRLRLALQVPLFHLYSLVEWIHRMVFLSHDYFVQGPESITDVKNLNLLATITNTGNETLKLLNDPLGPLSELPAHTFSITDTSGRQPIFTGIKVCRRVRRWAINIRIKMIIR